MAAINLQKVSLKRKFDELLELADSTDASIGFLQSDLIGKKLLTSAVRLKKKMLLQKYAEFHNIVNTTLALDSSIPTCPICLETYKEPTSTECGHIFCKSCGLAACGKKSFCLCPVCRKTIFSQDFKRVYL